MASLKKLEKKRRKAAHRSYVLSVELTRALEEKHFYETAIEEAKRKKNPTGVWAQLARIEAGIELLGRVAMKNRAVGAILLPGVR
jgi:hypothetical protein